MREQVIIGIGILALIGGACCISYGAYLKYQSHQAYKHLQYWDRKMYEAMSAHKEVSWWCASQ